MYYVYVIFSKLRKYIYVGLTNDVKRRFEQHQKGYNKKTRAYRPFQLINVELFFSRIDARKREKYLKSGIGKEWIKLRLLKD
ncbi:MAG: GIY-YIG nuclease family protein [Candidatus Omnitrophica bacterium]|nr:GIY-YIG nuclease family protein [Candidatus Omnitrophota bacterium]